MSMSMCLSIDIGGSRRDSSAFRYHIVLGRVNVTMIDHASAMVISTIVWRGSGGLLPFMDISSPQS